MYLKTVSFIVADKDTPCPDISNHGLYACTEEVTNIGDNYFCNECGASLIVSEVAQNLGSIRNNPLAADGFRCSQCLAK